MLIYQVSGTQKDGLDFSILIIPTEGISVGAYWKEESQGYPKLKQQLVNEKVIDTADKITSVEFSFSRQLETPTEIEFHAKSVSQCSCSFFTKVVACTVVALPIITATVLYAVDYLNSWDSVKR